MICCNADLDHPCDANDGDPCPSCASVFAFWERRYMSIPESVLRLDYITEDELEEELRDAGRIP